MENHLSGSITDSAGKRIGSIKIAAPPGADTHRITADGSSVAAKAFATGIETGRLVLELQTDPDVAGEYTVDIGLDDGDSVFHVIRTQ